MWPPKLKELPTPGVAPRRNKRKIIYLLVNYEKAFYHICFAIKNLVVPDISHVPLNIRIPMGSISPTFSTQLFHAQILKGQIMQSSCQSFLHFLDLRTLKLQVKCWLNRPQVWNRYNFFSTFLILFQTKKFLIQIPGGMKPVAKWSFLELEKID